MSSFLGEADYQHGSTEKIGVLLANLGTPTAPTAKALRRYLRQFLSDPRVIEAPRVQWQIILNTVILPFRSPRSAEAYSRVWSEKGSPLMVNCRAQQSAITAAMSDLPIAVELGMSYGEPSIANALRSLKKQNCRRLLVLPLYPQYANSTTGSVFTDASRELTTWRAIPHFRFVSAYCDDSRYITALADSITTHWQQHGKPDKLLFSFHGTPQSMLEAGDPYHCLCHKTARLTAEKLALQEDEWLITFQSRFGRAEWLQPYTDETMKQLPTQGVRHVQAVSPAFSSDCLETLEEIAMENRDYFIEAGGEKFSYIPALNDSPAHIKFLSDLIHDNIRDWLSHIQQENNPTTRDLQKENAMKLKKN